MSKRTVLRWLKKYNIKIRTISEALTGNICGKNHPMYGKKHRENSKEKMKKSRIGRLAWNKDLTKKTDERLDYERPTTFKKGDKRNEKWHKWRKTFKGKNHTNWLGGKSFEPYSIEFNNKLKRLIRKRDNQICMLCSKHREKLKRVLDVHHINYDKTCNLQQNLVSLCISCHTKTNFNRKHWTKLFQSLLTEKYNYKYSESGEIILEIKNEI